MKAIPFIKKMCGVGAVYVCLLMFMTHPKFSLLSLNTQNHQAYFIHLYFDLNNTHKPLQPNTLEVPCILWSASKLEAVQNV
jgi:hypothetical protein